MEIFVDSMKTILTFTVLFLVLTCGVSSVHAVGYLGTVNNPTEFTVAENTTAVGTIPVDRGSVVNADQVTVSVTGTDASNFSITFDSTNDNYRVVLSFMNHTPDYETKRSYTFNAMIDESTDGSADSITVNVAITDVNEAPTLTGTTTSILVNLIVETSGINVGPIFSATDPDAEDDTDINPENTGTDYFRYTLTGTHANRFKFVAVSGGFQLRTNALLDPDTDYSLTVQVFDGASDATSVLGSNTLTFHFRSGNPAADVTEFDFRSGNPAADVTETVIPEIRDISQPIAVATPPKPKATRRIVVTRCGLGWSPESQYQHYAELPKVMIYALEFEYDPGGRGKYIFKTIEIRTGDDAIENLAGWKLYLGTLYNPSYRPLEILEEHSQITDRILRLTPEMLGLEIFPCNTVGGISHPLPGVQYVLKTEENVVVDTAYSCFVWGQNAYTTVNGVNVKSKRQISSAALRGMDTPRIERYITKADGVFITYTGIEEFGWDRAVLSDWLLAASEESEVAGRNAPSAVYKKLATSWGALKMWKTDVRNRKRR